MSQDFMEIGSIEEDCRKKIHTWKLPEHLGTGIMQKVDIRSGMKLNFFNWKLNDHLNISFHDHERENEEGFISFDFCTSGLENIMIDNNNQNVVIQKGFNTITIANGSLSTNVEMLAKVTNNIVGVQITPSYFNELLCDESIVLPEVFRQIYRGHVPEFFVHTMPSIPQIRVVVEQLLNHLFSGPASLLYFEGQALTLISLMIQLMEDHHMKKDGQFHVRANDVERIHFARELLAKNIANPPSLNDLSNYAGMNHFKLNCGFKHVYGNTVFGVLKEMRVEQAKKLLINGEMNVTEVSLAVGYSCLSHFAKVFKEQYGVSPKAYLKRLTPVSKAHK